MSDEPKDIDDWLRVRTVQFVLDRNNEFTDRSEESLDKTDKLMDQNENPIERQFFYLTD